MSSDVPNSIIHYLYSFSPFARRIVWYLTLRNIPHAQCIQPVTLPRPDINALGVQYRRIPILTIGRDIYLDTRVILHALEKQFPNSDSRFRPLATAVTPEQRALQKLFEHYTVDAGVFTRMAQCIPLDSPLLKDPKFTKDRENFTGSSWNFDDYSKMRPEALVHMRQAFELLEDIFSDEREWVLGTQGPSLGDIEAIWPFHWLAEMKGAFPPEVISEQQFPKTFAWIARFSGALKEAEESNTQRQVVKVKGDEAVKHIVESNFLEGELSVDNDDPIGLKEGTEVQIWPIDSGFRHKDHGTLVGLTKEEVVISTQTQQAGKEVRVHAPRWGFRIRESGENAKL